MRIAWVRWPPGEFLGHIAVVAAAVRLLLLQLLGRRDGGMGRCSERLIRLCMARRVVDSIV